MLKLDQLNGKFKIWLMVLVIITGPASAFTQDFQQVVRGLIVDDEMEINLEGATVRVFNENFSKGTISDENGLYKISEVPVGYYELEISYVGYARQLVSEVLVESAKETIMNVRMQASDNELDEVVVRGSVNRSRSSAVTSLKTITVEETLRFPATFYDPARLATTFAGVVSQNDQANHMSIRGNSPNGMVWRLEGVEIVNPNHTSNAGTLSDRPTRNGGGVNILSAQLLGTSDFMSGAFPAEYGNALSGVLDMHLRKGNEQQHEFTAQIGLIGLDLAAEGPLSNKNTSSYLVNYRYSTLGILSELGVDLGDEAISFQDLSFNLSLPTENAGRFTVFGVGGISENIFEGPRDTSLIEFEKDRFDISFDSKMAALGATHVIPFGASSVLRSALVFSYRDNLRTSDFLTPGFITSPQARDDFAESRLGLSAVVSSKPNTRLLLRYGALLTRHHYDYNSFYSNNLFETRINGVDDGWLVEPFFNAEVKLGGQFLVNAGIHYLYFTFNDAQSVEPRLSFVYNLSQRQHINLAYGIHSNTQLPQLYFEESATSDLINEDLGLNKAHHLVLSYKNHLSPTTILNTEIYYQSLYNIPVETDPQSTYSAINDADGFRVARTELENTGTGTNMGLEVSLQKYLSKNYYFLINGSLYDSKYVAKDGVERNTRFNGNYILNLIGGKEFIKNKSKKTRTFGLNTRIAYVGGYRDTPIDLEASALRGETVYTNDAYSIKQRDFFRVDLRLYFKNDKKNFTSTFGMDIQNLTNSENLAYSYYDTEKGEVLEKLQLGLIPNLTYRIEF